MSNNLVAYYRLGDSVGSYSVQDSSGNGNTGSLVNGVNGEPSYGATGVFLYDTDGALDLTAAANIPNGGFSTNDQTTEPPTVHDPLNEADEWTVEMWFQWVGSITVPAAAIIPPGLTTNITHASGFPTGNVSIPAAASVISDAAYATVGDLAILGIVVGSGTVTVTQVDGEVSDGWTLQVRNQDAANNQCVDVWTSTVTSTAAPDVLTVSYSVDSPDIGAYYWIDSLTVGQGANTIWGIPDFGINSGNSVTTTVTYPSLDATVDTNPQAYWGLGSSSGNMSAGSAGGFTYEYISNNAGLALNLDVYSGGNPWQPTAVSTSGTFQTVGIIIEASIETAASTAAVPNATMMRVNYPNEFEPFTSYELQIGFAEVIGNTPGQTSVINDAVVEAFGEYDGSNVWQYASNPFDGAWHHLVKSNVLPYPYLDGHAPSGLNSEGDTTLGANIAGILFGTAPGGVGLDPNGGTTYAQPFTGILDEVALYDTVLTTEQITNHYNTALWFQQQEYAGTNGAANVGRTNKVLAVAGLDPTTIFAVPYAFLTELYAETDTVTTTSALNYIQTTSETEPGLIFQGPDGLIHGYNRQYQYLNPTSTTVQASFADNESSTYFYDGPSLAIAGDDLDLWNDIQVQSGIPSTLTTDQIEVGALQEWGPAQSALAAYSASVYGNRTLQGLTALQFAHDQDALAVAQNYLQWYALPLLRITQVTINAQGNRGANIPQMLQRGLYDRLQLEYTGQTPGPTFTQQSVIEQITHSVDMSIPEWSTTFAMSPYEILMEPFIIGVSTIGGPAVLTL